MSGQQLREVVGKSRRHVAKLLGVGVLASATGLRSSRRAEAARGHLCCVSECTDGTFRHQCTRKNACPPAPFECELACQYPVTKCSACGLLDETVCDDT